MASKLYDFTRQQLQDLLDSNGTYMSILRAAGIESSSSTNTLKRIISEHDLDTSKFEENNPPKDLSVENTILNQNLEKIQKHKVIN